MFATASGGVRRNRLSDFTNVMANGKIAMKLADGDHLVGARVFEEADNVFLATRQGASVCVSRLPMYEFSAAGHPKGFAASI